DCRLRWSASRSRGQARAARRPRHGAGSLQPAAAAGGSLRAAAGSSPRHESPDGTAGMGRDPPRPVEERRVALRLVIHWGGDLHQPLHVGDNGDRGGNDTQVRFFNRGSNTHRVWDCGILERAGRVEDARLADLTAMDTPEARATALSGSVEDWATESL